MSVLSTSFAPLTAPDPRCPARQIARMVNGAEAMGAAYWLAGARLAYTFPITPQSEVIDYFSSHPDIDCVQADSEYNVIAGAEGVLWGGQRCAIATSSQGLVLMSEVMWEVAGNRLPMVMGVFSRGLKGPGWCLGTQQTDALFMRDTGWMQFYCESAQEILDFVLMGHRLAESTGLPILIVGDGFYLSHEVEEVLIPEAGDARAFVGEPSWPAMPLTGPPASFGALVPPDRYSRFYQTLHQDMTRAADRFEEIGAEYHRRFGREYHLLIEHRLEDAEIVVVAAGALCGATQEAIDELWQNDCPTGLLKIHAFRPFPAAQIVSRLSGARRIIVLDRNLAPGFGGIFAAHVRGALQAAGVTTPVFGVVTGLGGLDVTPAMIQALVYSIRGSETAPRGPVFLDERGIH